MKVYLLLLTCFFSAQALALKFDSNVPADLQQQILEDLSFMATITGTAATPLHKQIYGEVSGADYKEFFDTRIFAVGLSGCGSASAVACVMPSLNPNKMWLTKNFVNFSHPQIARSMIVYHEARHSEVKNRSWFHASCPRPFLDENGMDKKSIWTGAKLEGQPACDISPFGSYGSTTIMLKNLAKHCENCNEKVKMDADIYSDDQLGRITDAKAKADMLADFQN